MIPKSEMNSYQSDPLLPDGPVNRRSNSYCTNQWRQSLIVLYGAIVIMLLGNIIILFVELSSKTKYSLEGLFTHYIYMPLLAANTFLMSCDLLTCRTFIEHIGTEFQKYHSNFNLIFQTLYRIMLLLYFYEKISNMVTRDDSFWFKLFYGTNTISFGLALCIIHIPILFLCFRAEIIKCIHRNDPVELI